MDRATARKANASRGGGGRGNGGAARSRRRAARGDSHPAEQVRELFRGEVLKAKARLVQLLEHGSERAALEAANAILDRAFGKPRQVAEVPEERHALAPIEFYEVDCVTRPEADGPGMGGHD